MTRPEITGSREGDLRILSWFREKFPNIEIDEKSEDLRISRWIRFKLPNSKKEKFVVTDLDIIPANCTTRQIMLLETKTKNTNITFSQRKTFNNFHHCIKKGIKNDYWDYLGFHGIKFERKFFNDGKCFWDKEEITEKELIKRFSWIGMITYLDFILSNYMTKKIMLLKVKTHSADFTFIQKELFASLDIWLMKGMGFNWKYLGLHLIQFENSFFNDGKCYFDRKKITEEKLIELFWRLFG